MGARDECLYMAKLAEQAERWEDMIEYIKRVVSIGQELNVNERDMLSAAYKNSVSTRRKAWRIVNDFEQRELSKVTGDQTSGSGYEAVAGYKQQVTQELQQRCEDILTLLNEPLISGASDSESKVFYMKMKGDYLRYSAEFSADQEKLRCAKEAKEAYKEATEIAKTDLPAHSHLRLGLALNFAVFYYEVMDGKLEACRQAKAAFDEGIAAFEALPADQQKEDVSAQTILSLLRDNLTLWTTEQVDGGGGPEHDGTAVQDL